MRKLPENFIYLYKYCAEEQECKTVLIYLKDGENYTNETN